MDPNACPQCGARLFANRTCRCGWPKKKARKAGPRIIAATLVGDKTCRTLGCGGAAGVGQLCWRHYRQLRKEIPADRGKGLGLYRGMPRKLISDLANQKRAERLRGRQHQLEARELLFGKAGGRMMNLPLEQRQFVNRVSHESHERYLFRCHYVRAVPPMSFRAFRRRWYGAQKANWRRFDVPRMMNARFRTSLNEA
jgi:hypothetical protein